MGCAQTKVQPVVPADGKVEVDVIKQDSTRKQQTPGARSEQDAIEAKNATGDGRVFSVLLQKALAGGTLYDGGQRDRSNRTVADCAVSLAFLVDFAKDIPKTWTTEDVVYKRIVPSTKELQCRYVELLQSDQVSPPAVFAIHRCGSDEARHDGDVGSVHG